MHKSYDKLKHEKHRDKFNIDFLRYFTWNNFICGILGSIIGALVYLLFLVDEIMMIRESIVAIILLGAFFVFLFMSSIAYRATGELKESLAIAGKRGLNSFIIITSVDIIAIASSGIINLQSTFGDFLYILLGSMIVTAFIALFFDFGATYKKE
ncbi:MAG: hypothetical protein ACQEP1_06365 [Nanobdellota archaeon]